MKVTFILRNLSDEFYNGSKYIESFNDLDPSSKFEKLKSLARDLPKNIQEKIGSGQFRDAVELNALTKKPYSVTYTIEPRRGYKLATFIFVSV